MTNSSRRVTEQTVDQFKRAFIKRCIAEGTDRIQLTFDELSKITGLSRASVYKATDELVRQGFLKKETSKSRRYPNTYVLVGPVEVGEGVASQMVKDGKEFVESYHELQRKFKDLQERYTDLKSDFDSAMKALASGGEIVSRAELPGGLVQITIRKSDS